MDKRCTITVGGDAADIRAFTNGHIQSAVDRAASLGGGLVQLTAGVFHMADALHLRSNVTVKGCGCGTVLQKNPMKKSALATLVGYGHDDLPVEDPDRFEVGEGVLVSSQKTGGFLDTTGTLLRREGNTWFINRTANMDYSNVEGGCVRTLFPLVDAMDVENASVEDLLLLGRAAENERINGCRGGAFFAYRSRRVAARRVVAQDFHGDGFSFQTCDDLELDSCVAEACTSNGFHPGSGSNRFHIHGCVARRCGGCGLFYCLRVRDSILEDCVFEDNKSHGLMIWARDDRHINRRLTFRRNGGCGLCFMANPPGQESNDHTFEGCTFEENCTSDGPAEILLQGHATGTRLIGNRIQRRAGKPGILVAPGMPPFENRNNIIEPDGPDAVVFQNKTGD